MMAKGGLGRGLSALIKDEPDGEKPAAGGLMGRTVGIDSISRSGLQPRQSFSDERMDDLIRSVKERGVVQPLLVRAKGEGYELVAGERRHRAARSAGLAEVPVIVVDASDQETLELALVENLQREDLNVLEEAQGYRTLAEKFGMTQEQIADRVGKPRASVANRMRILGLPDEITTLIADGRLSEGHAKVLLGIEIPEEQALLALQTVREDLSVRNLEKLVEKFKSSPRKPRARRDDIPPQQLNHVMNMLRRRFGTAVKVVPCRTLANGKKVRGKMEIDFYSVDDLNRILDLLGLSDGQEDLGE